MILKRVAAGIMVAIFFSAMLASSWGPLLLLVLLALASASLYEFYAIAASAGYRVYRTFGIVCGICWILCEYIFLPPFVSAVPHPSPYALWSPMALFIVFFAIMVRTMFDKGAGRAMESGAITFLGFLYLPVMLSYYVRVAQWETASGSAATRAAVFLAFFLTMVVKMSDTGAFAAGTLCSRTIGTHPMFPRISPKKSWEGLAGGVAVGSATGLALAFLARRHGWGPDGVFWSSSGAAPLLGVGGGVLLSLLLVAVGVFGDLIESMLKRAAAIKDSASIIPGIGGLLDVVDSLVFAPITLYFALQFAASLR
ncbi:MAG: phosphatidate cytidylyltransferase [Kiritimatiellae bacterium]|nr:phosphatidate cytidylyltransferase [Kiritimatiellia bacterium]